MKLYRCYDWQTAPGLDEFDEPCGPSKTRIGYREYEVIKETEKSFLVQEVMGGWRGLKKRWVRKNATRCFATPCRTDAIRHFIARKTAQIRILGAQLESAKEAKALAEKTLKNN